MKTLFTLFFAMLIVVATKAQTNPTMYNNLGTNYIDNTFLDKATNDLYLCYAELGYISKVNLSAPNLSPTLVISGLTFPIDMTVVNNKLYFIEATSGLDASENPIPNTGKLYSLDLSVPGATKVLLMSGLNTPSKIEGNTSYIIIDENTVNPTTGTALTQQVSKLNLSGTPTKTLLMSRTNAGAPNQRTFEKLVLDGNMLYAASTDFSTNANFYSYNLQNNVYAVTHTFTSDIPASGSFGENEGYFYYSVGGNGLSAYRVPVNGSISTPITVNYKYNGEGTNYYDWNFDNANNAFVYGDTYNSYTETMRIFKYNASELLSTKEVNNTVKISFFPNPAKAQLNFSEELTEIKIIDMSGKQVSIQKEKSKTINVEKLARGNYLITAKDKNGKTISDKFIKE